MLIQGNAKEWKEYVEHEFVKQLGAGTLSQKAFAHFIVLVNSLCIERCFTSCAGKTTII